MITSRVLGGRYVILAEIGRGRTGIVWRAEDRVTGRRVAAKELRVPDGVTEPQRQRFRERLLRETRIASRLDEPGIVAVHDVVTEAGPDGILRDNVVMELFDGRSLAEVVVADGPLDEGSAAAVGRRVLAALRAAHANGVVHRAVTPGNVLLARCGRVGLTDFGVTPVDEAERAPRPLAPQGRTTDGAPSAAVDLWGLGATLFHAVQGTAPPRAGAAPDPACCRDPLATVIAGLLEPDPDARLSAADAAALLDPTAATGAPAPHTPPWGTVLAVALAFALGVLLGAVLL